MADHTVKSDGSAVAAFFSGATNLISIPAFILMMSFVGFGALAREAGLSVFEAMVLAFSTWALPSAVVVTGAVIAGAPFYATVFAVILASIRLMPMTMSLVPILKAERTKTWHLLIASNFIAVTAWVFAMNRLPDMPRAIRLPFFIGFGFSLAVVNMGITGLSHTLVTSLPPFLAAALLFLTPIYFLVSMTQASRVIGEYLAIFAGLLFGPVFYLLSPETGLLWCGLVGGSVSYGAARLLRKGAD